MKTPEINRVLSPKQKALSVNLDPSIYGSFAEIGAGQEVAQQFFNAGAASGSIAKTMSAYDMKFSDAIYGAEDSGRYVCEPRLQKMLEKEYELLEIRLREERPDTAFFAFANTVEVLNYHKTNKGHGWYGLKFQTHAGQAPNEVIMHVNLQDNHRHLQQEVSGLLGVNLIYGCYNHYEDIERLLVSMLENISRDRVEIDMFRVSGPAFEEVDNRIVSLKLVKNGMSDASMFGPDGYVRQPSEVLYKKNILALRGRFRPMTLVNTDMLNRAHDMFLEDPDVDPDRVVKLAELTLNNLTMKEEGGIDEQDFLDRVDILCSMGCTVMISNYHEYYRLIEYLSPFTRRRKIGMVLGVFNLADIFKEKFYTNLNGGVLEALGRLFGQNVKLYVYPSRIPGSSEIIDKDNLELPDNKMMHLYNYLKVNDKFETIRDFDESILHIYSDYVLALIKSGRAGWENMVPEQVERAVKEKCLFGYPCSIEEHAEAIVKREAERQEKEGDKQ
ncbi:MAG: TonB-dependent receptor, partial [Bacteroidota bacterium]